MANKCCNICEDKYSTIELICECSICEKCYNDQGNPPVIQCIDCRVPTYLELKEQDGELDTRTVIDIMIKLYEKKKKLVMPTDLLSEHFRNIARIELLIYEYQYHLLYKKIANMKKYQTLIHEYVQTRIIMIESAMRY